MINGCVYPGYVQGDENAGGFCYISGPFDKHNDQKKKCVIK